MIRYAVYFVPSTDDPLWRFGCQAVGYDSATGEEVPFHDAPFYRAPQIAEWTADPRRYGFHATLKPPFHFADGAVVEDLEQSLAEFSATTAPVELGHLAVSILGRFLALTPREAGPAASEFAAKCVRAFEAFRAPLSEADRARRLAGNLTERQVAYLDQWGYPYVFEEFRFHMTLTGRLPDDATSDAARDQLSDLYAAIDRPVRIDALTLCEQATRDSRFRVRRRFQLTG